MAITYVLVSALLTASCSSDNDSDPVNHPPGSFNLTPFTVISGFVSNTPEFNWNEAVDPDNDPVVYDLYVTLVGTDFAEVAPIAQNLEATNYQVMPKGALIDGEKYQWKVLAKDNRGGETWSNILQFEVIAE